jgi:ubiquinone/menaquinone biosynthesis C-methylase UbiE
MHKESPAVKRYASRRFARRFDRLRRYDVGMSIALERIDLLRAFRGSDVVELGAGTGFLTMELSRRANYVYAFDKSRCMLEFAQRKLKRLGISNCELRLADHRAIPLPDACADLVVAAWTLASLVYEAAPDGWRLELDRVVAEMRRLVRQGGVIAVLCPVEPGPRNYLQHLRLQHGFWCLPFESRWSFPSRRRARKVLQFFFNQQTWEAYRARVPEQFVTRGGVWWLPAGRSECVQRGM